MPGFERRFYVNFISRTDGKTVLCEFFKDENLAERFAKKFHTHYYSISLDPKSYTLEVIDNEIFHEHTDGNNYRFRSETHFLLETKHSVKW